MDKIIVIRIAGVYKNSHTTIDSTIDLVVSRIQQVKVNLLKDVQEPGTENRVDLLNISVYTSPDEQYLLQGEVAEQFIEQWNKITATAEELEDEKQLLEELADWREGT